MCLTAKLFGHPGDDLREVLAKAVGLLHSAVEADDASQVVLVHGLGERHVCGQRVRIGLDLAIRHTDEMPLFQIFAAGLVIDSKHHHLVVTEVLLMASRS